MLNNSIEKQILFDIPESLNFIFTKVCACGAIKKSKHPKPERHHCGGCFEFTEYKQKKGKQNGKQ
jgi:hypothetical protein